MSDTTFMAERSTSYLPDGPRSFSRSGDIPVSADYKPLPSDSDYTSAPPPEPINLLKKVGDRHIGPRGRIIKLYPYHL